MPSRFTNTDKWTSDAWFIGLQRDEKLLFLYLCETCDMAGFVELSFRKWSFDTGIDIEKIEGALKGLQRGFMKSHTESVIFLRNFLKHQKNLPLNPMNKAHSGIIKRLESHLNDFNFESINEYFQAPTKGLPSPTGIGIGKGKGKGEEEKGVQGEKQTAGSIVFFDHTILRNELLSSDQWKDEICRTSKIDPEHIDRLIEEFCSIQHTSDQMGRSLSDFKRHFTQWVRKNPKPSGVQADQPRMFRPKLLKKTGV